MRNKVWAVAALISLLAFMACDGTTTIMATEGVTLNVSAGTVQVQEGFEVDPDTSPVRLSMTRTGYFAFDGESWGNVTGDARQDIHSTIKERFPNADVKRIRQMTLNGAPVLFVYIKKPGVND